MLKKELLLVFTILTVLSVSVLANGDHKIKTIGILGKGIAILEGDFSNVKIAKVGIAIVKVDVFNETEEVKVGVLFLDSDKYRLRNVEFGNQSASADVYFNETKVGTFTANLIVKPEHNLWHGVLVLNDQTWHLYLLEGTRKVKAEESGENVREVCEENPEKCRPIGRGIGDTCDDLNSTNCRDKIKEFCKENPDDRRCVSLFRDYCKNHLLDSRCREELKELCEENPEDEQCETFCRFFPALCGREGERECCFVIEDKNCVSREEEKCKPPTSYPIDCDSERCVGTTTTETNTTTTPTTTTTTERNNTNSTGE